MPSLENSVLVIIRSAGERTESLCQALILEQGVPAENVVIVREAPFSATMRKSFEIGIERGLPWTLCVDADVLLRPGSIRKMLWFASRQPRLVCEVQGNVLCKYFGGPRPAGNHLYRTSLLKRIIDCIPAEGVNIRPEFYSLEKMSAQGFPWVAAPYLLGLHDFEQSLRDIFRKCFIQAHKHNYLADLFLPFWEDGAHTDEDYRIALVGFARGLEYHGPVFIDAQNSLFDVNLANYGLMEKGPINLADWSLNRVESISKNWREPQAYLDQFPDRLGADTAEANLLEPSLYDDKSAQHCFYSTVPYWLGKVIKRIGLRIQKWSGGR